MRELNGMEYAGIGAVFGTSAEAARQTVYEARIALQELAEGREMRCEQAKRAISSGDRRVLRGRKLRAHLRACEDCRDFREAIRERKADFAALAPPMPALAAAGLLQQILGSGHAGGGSGGLLGALGGGGKVVAGSTALKSAAAVVATATVVVGAGEVTGVIDPVPGAGSSKSSPVRAGSAQSAAPAGAARSEPGAVSPTAKDAGPGARADPGRGAGRPRSQGHSGGHPKSAAGVSHPGGPPAGPRGHSDFGKSHAPANPSPPAHAHPVPPVTGAKAGHPAAPSSAPKPVPVPKHSPPVTPTPPAQAQSENSQAP